MHILIIIVVIVLIFFIPIPLSFHLYISKDKFYIKLYSLNILLLNNNYYMQMNGEVS